MVYCCCMLGRWCGEGWGRWDGSMDPGDRIVSILDKDDELES
jgi:hypothetical protein